MTMVVVFVVVLAVRMFRKLATLLDHLCHTHIGHWQQSHSIRWSYISARRLAGSVHKQHLQKCVVYVGVVRGRCVHRKIHGLQTVIQLAKVLR
jgi:hypothetical protein